MKGVEYYYLSKNKIIEYCKELGKIDTKHIEEAVENKRLIEAGKYRELNGCPQNFGLDDYVGLCEIEKEPKSYQDELNQCERCWKKALNINNE